MMRAASQSRIDIVDACAFLPGPSSTNSNAIAASFTWLSIGYLQSLLARGKDFGLSVTPVLQG